jgi:hypothetical protein
MLLPNAFSPSPLGLRLCRGVGSTHGAQNAPLIPSLILTTCQRRVGTYIDEHTVLAAGNSIVVLCHLAL